MQGQDEHISLAVQEANTMKSIAGTLAAPFPWFGGKANAAELVWQAFGVVDNYVEPFAGSAAQQQRRMRGQWSKQP